MKILFVCSGNTCRSPMAEELARVKFADKQLNIEEVASAGIYCGFGEQISQNAQTVLEERGITSYHLSQPVTRTLADSYDLIVTMTWQHKAALAPFVEEDKLISFREISPMGDIPDPFGGSVDDYRNCLEEIDKALDYLVEYIGERNA
ncbi:MAG: low molecular weight protein arginine phosphatase [Clostridia bacterium]|nr:low molecular weight protein arginine phosphatase [Clostridia bacterium]